MTAWLPDPLATSAVSSPAIGSTQIRIKTDHVSGDGRKSRIDNVSQSQIKIASDLPKRTLQALK